MSNMAFCRSCGKELHETAKACPGCGAAQATKGEKNRMTAAALAFLFGGFGAHKFYLGKGGQGVLYLLFFWTLIPSFIAFIECISYLCSSDEVFARKYG
jgi:TM2 domain-containing membrane protein YozV